MNDFIKNKIMIIRSFLINLRIFNLKIALKSPIYYSYNIKVKGLYKGCIILNNKDIKKGMIRFGVTEEESNLKNDKNYLYFKENGKLILKGKIDIKSGMSILVGKNSNLILGDNFKAGSNCYIYSSSRIEIDDNVRFEFNVKLKNDNNYIVYEDELEQKIEQIKIEDNVLVKANTILLSSTFIAKNSIISEGSIINKRLEKRNSLYGGNPVNLIKTNVVWRKKL